MINKLYKYRDWLFNQYITLKKTPKEIGEICGVSHTTIHNWLKKYEISMRSRSETMKIVLNKPEIIKKMSNIQKVIQNNPKTKKKQRESHKGKKCYLFGKFGKDHPAYKENKIIYERGVKII